jgi:hypothetical protein
MNILKLKLLLNCLILMTVALLGFSTVHNIKFHDSFSKDVDFPSVQMNIDVRCSFFVTVN